MAPPKPTAVLTALLSAWATLSLVSPDTPSANASVERCYFPSSFFCQRLAPNAPIDPDSAGMVTELRNMAYGVAPDNPVDCKHAVMTDNPLLWTAEERRSCWPLTYRAGINYDAYAPMLYTVPAGQRRVPVLLHAGDSDLKAALLDGVPIPPEARPAGGSDGQLVIYQPSTDTMWEFWRARKDITGSWHASWGGVIPDVSQNPGHYEDVVNASGGYVERHSWGGPSSSIPNLPGLLTADQLRSGVIGHALVFSTWANHPGEWVYPAQRTDGRCRGALGEHCAGIPQGARFRLDPDFAVDGLANPIVRMIAQAVQDYGMVLNNTTGSGLSFYAEGWRGHPESGDPYYGPGGLFESDPAQRATTRFMREFPWEHLQMLQRGTTCSDASRQCEPPAGWPFAGSGTAVDQAYDPPSADARLRLARPEVVGRRLVASGTVRPRSSGSIQVDCRRVGDARDRKHAPVRDGEFRAAFRLPKHRRTGRYVLIARYRADANHSGARVRRTVTID
jgi:hypothetical protein